MREIFGDAELELEDSFGIDVPKMSDSLENPGVPT